MTNLGYLLVCTFGNFLMHFLVAAYTFNNLALFKDKRFEDEGHESD